MRMGERKERIERIEMNRIVPEAEYRELRQYDHEDGREEGEDREEQGQVVPGEPLDLGAQRGLVLGRPTANGV